MAVTVLMLNSVGANTVLAIISQTIQKILPPKKQAGIITNGLAVRNNNRRMCGTAIPTKEMGPANAVTQAESSPDNKIMAARRNRMFTPMFCA